MQSNKSAVLQWIINCQVLKRSDWHKNIWRICPYLVNCKFPQDSCQLHKLLRSQNTCVRESEWKSQEFCLHSTHWKFIPETKPSIFYFSMSQLQFPNWYEALTLNGRHKVSFGSRRFSYCGLLNMANEANHIGMCGTNFHFIALFQCLTNLCTLKALSPSEEMIHNITEHAISIFNFCFHSFSLILS